MHAARRFSIHARDKAGIREAEDSFPVPVRGTSSVYHCGFHDEKSFGCASYLVLRPEGNVMVDVPRFVPKLLKKIQVMAECCTLIACMQLGSAHHSTEDYY